MAVEKISIEQFLQMEEQVPVLDVRSPGEYDRGHIPGARPFPLFTDEERKITGTAYKQVGRQEAIKIGLNYFGKKMASMVATAETIAKDGTVIVHCWRGGMRSEGVGWLLDLYGLKVYTLSGGYKSFRRWCHQQFRKEVPFMLVGGYTGSGKTKVLAELKDKGHKIIDLEGLACHKGSVFGGFGQPAPPSQEMFENKLALALAASGTEDRLWVEDESRRIGSLHIPDPLYRRMRSAPVRWLEIPFEERLNNILVEYGKFPKEDLAAAILLLRKRLGGLETRSALLFLEAGDLRNCFSILLKYYDKYYLKGYGPTGEKTQEILKIPCTNTDPKANANALLYD